MKSLLLLLVTVAIVCFLWFSAFPFTYSREKYLSEKVLELSTPINVKIDIEFLKGLGPAYEQ